MTEPIYSETLERWYETLPLHVRREDIAQDYALKKWISGIGDQQGELDTLVDRFTYISPEDGEGHRTSDLADPATADQSWLAWLGQFVGVKVDPDLSVSELRLDIANALSGVRVGTKQAIARIAARTLVGSKFVTIYDHSTDAGVGAGGEWDVLIVTLDSETLTNDMNPSQATISSTDGWVATVYLANLFTSTAWVVSGMTLGSGTTQPLLSSYDTLSGAGNAYLSGVAYPGVDYGSKLALRCDDGLATSATVEIVFLDNTSTELDTTALTVGVIGTDWKWISGSAVAPAGTVEVRLRITRGSAGVLLVSCPITAPGGIPELYFGSSFVGVTTEDGILTSPKNNYARNSSYDVYGGWVPANGVLSLTTDRFIYHNSAAELVVSASSASADNAYNAPAFEGEQVSSSVWIEGGIAGATAQLEIIFTKSNGTTVSVYGDPVTITDTDFLEVSAAGTAPVNGKSWDTYLHITGATVDNSFFIDGWKMTRGADTYSYFDGNSAGCSWSTSPVSDAVTVGSKSAQQVIVPDPNLGTSSLLKVVSNSLRAALEINLNESFATVPVTATDPYVHMVTLKAGQTGTYYGVLLIIYTDGGDVEKGRAWTAGPVTEESIQFTVVTASVPSGATKAQYRAFIFGSSKDDVFYLSKGGSRLGTFTEWVPVNADPVGEVINAGQKPSGILLYHTTFQSTWAAIEAAYPTWNDWEGANWQQIEETGI